MRYAFIHHLQFINWKKEAQLINVKNEVFKAKMLELKEAGGHICESKTKRIEFIYPDYGTDLKGSYRYLYLRDKDGSYKIYTTNIHDDNKNTGMINNAGKRSISAVQNKFKEIYGCTFRKKFAYVEEEFKICIPKSFIYIDKNWCNKVIWGVSSIDGCSQYPSNLCGLLPDAHNFKQIKGTVEPTKDYPFAFYLKSGHSAQLNVYDTHNWITNKYYPYLFNFASFNEDCKPENDVTVLMKASDAKFDTIMQEYYDKRKIDPSAKLALNSTIGYFHTKNYAEYKLAHLAAVCIARSNQCMLDKIEEIGSKRVIHVCVDGIIYIGSQEFGINEKKFGNFFQEYTDCNIYIKSTNAYIVMKDDKIVKAKHGAFNKNKDGTPIVEENIKSFDEINNWIKVDYFEDKEYEQ